MPITWKTEPRGGKPHVPGLRPKAGSARGNASAIAVQSLPGLAAAVLLAIGSALPAVAAPPCMQEAERAAFDVRALQSQIMVVALVCGRQDDYDTLVRRHQSGFLSAYQEITSHFRQLHGARAGGAERDRYITELAQIQAQEQVRHGAAFCGNMDPFVRRIMAARDTGEIARISTAANLATPPYRLATCTGPMASAPRTPAMPFESSAETGEPDGRDEEMRRLQDKLDRLERLLERQSEPPLRRVGAKRAALSGTER